MPAQQELAFRTWGGRRRGAGRPPAQERARVPHVAREVVRAHQPVHVTLRMADHVWHLRSERSYAVIHRALEAARRRPDARVVHFSVQGDHVHLILEADGTRAVANAVRALSIRLARGLNRMMGRGGAVFADRYHAHVLRTPAEVRNALRYVLGNFASHAAARGAAAERVGRPVLVGRGEGAAGRAARALRGVSNDRGNRPRNDRTSDPLRRG